MTSNATIRKIALGILIAQRKRHLFTVISITLTSFLIASIFSIGMSLFESLRVHSVRLQGSVSHMEFDNPTLEQISALPSINYVRYFGMGHPIGASLSLPGHGNISFLLNYLIFVLFRNAEPTAQFTYPFVLMVLLFGALFLLCLCTPKTAYRSICELTLAERLRLEE